jgi:hypothetical protein
MDRIEPWLLGPVRSAATKRGFGGANGIGCGQAAARRLTRIPHPIQGDFMSISSCFERSVLSVLCGRWGRALVGAGLLVLLAACGGGGGSGIGGGDTLSVSVNTSSLQLSVLEGDTSGQGGATLTVTAAGKSATPDIYLDSSVSGVGVRSPLPFNILNATTAEFSAVPDGGLAAGTYSGTIALKACKDSACVAQQPGSPMIVSYTVTVIPRFSASALQVDLVADEGGSSASTAVSLNLPAGVSTVTLGATNYDFGGSGWLNASLTGNTLNLSANAAGLASGTYTAAVNLSIAQPVAQSLTVPVSLSVSSGLLVPASAAHALLGISATELQGQVTVDLAAGTPSVGWSATRDATATWLVLDQASGSPGQALSWHLDTASLSGLGWGAQRTATVHVTAGSLSPKDLTVTVTNQLPRLRGLDTLALKAGQAGPVLVWVDGSSSGVALTDLRIDGGVVTPVSLTPVGPGLLSLTLPALSAGAHTVELINALQVSGPTLTLQVLTPVDRSSAVVPTQGTKGTLVWDAVRQVAFVRNTSMGSLMRFDLSGATPAVAARNLSGLSQIGLSRDHTQLYAMTSDGRWLNLSPDTLATVSDRALQLFPLQAALDIPLAITGDNLAWVSQGSASSLDLTDAAALPQSPTVAGALSGTPGFVWSAVSPDGRRMLVTQASGITPTPPLLWRDATGAVQAADGGLHLFPEAEPIDFFYRIASDRQGNRWALESMALYDFSLNKLGDLSLPAGWTPLRTAISGDGSRTYVYALDNSAIGTYAEPSPIAVWPRIFVFDTTTAPVTTTSYPVLGFIDLTDYPACRATQGPVVCEPYALNFVLTDDDRTLLAIGDRNLIVVPVPVGNLRATGLGVKAGGAFRGALKRWSRGAASR